MPLSRTSSAGRGPRAGEITRLAASSATCVIGASMSADRTVHRWSPESPSAELVEQLEERVRRAARDRVSSSRALVTELSAALDEWIQARLGTADTEVTQPLQVVLEPLLAELARAQGWRGPVARWLRAVKTLVGSHPSAARSRGVEELLAEECGLWLGGFDRKVAASSGVSVVWDGRPLSSGRRIPDRDLVARHAVDGARREAFCQSDIVLTIGQSETVVRSLLLAWNEGLTPHIIVGEGVPDLAGRRTAQRLAKRGIGVTLTYDAALADAVARADRIWLGTEAHDETSFVARVGTEQVVAEARRRNIPVSLLATSDKFISSAERTSDELELPGSAEADGWLLWEEPPEGVQLEPQAYTRMSLESIDVIVDEHGHHPSPGRGAGESVSRAC